jgi:uncharacterized phage protein (TIGR01671 family)
MREIKFRAWDTKNNCFLSHAFVVNQTGSVFFEYNGGGHIQNHIQLSQFTGLKDKNGKEIYEGDIIHRVDKFEPKGAHVVVFAFGAFHLSPDGVAIPYNLYPVKAGFQSGGSLVSAEVIGNIYENHDLLK